MIGLVSCASQPQAVAQVAPTVSPSAILTSTPLPKPSITPTPSPTVTRIPTVTPTATPAFKMCSPLPLHPLEELPQIIGDSYKPPPPGKEERHHGIDFGYWHYKDRDSMLGEPLQAVFSGKVAASIQDKYPYGNMVMIETPLEDLPADLAELIGISPGESLYILFAHMNNPPLVGLGDMVDACQTMGEVGMSGNTDIPHLHLETRLGPAGAVFESMRFYDTRATQLEMDNYKLWRTSGEFRHFDPMTLFAYQAMP